MQQSLNESIYYFFLKSQNDLENNSSVQFHATRNPFKPELPLPPDGTCVPASCLCPAPAQGWPQRARKWFRPHSHSLHTFFFFFFLYGLFSVSVTQLPSPGEYIHPFPCISRHAYVIVDNFYSSLSYWNWK